MPKRTDFIDSCKPVLGILAEVHPEHLKILGSQTNMLEEMCRFAENTSLRIVVSSIRNCNEIIENKKISGLFLHDGKWCQAVFSPPSLWYDRVFSDLALRDTDLRQCRSKLMQSARVSFLNPPAMTAILGDKLAFSRFCARHALPTPVTSPLEPEFFRNACCQPGRFIVKPRFGRKGIGIIRCGFGTDGRGFCSTHGHQVPFHTLSELEGILSELVRQVGLTREDYIVQAEIPSATVDGRWCDIRCMVQRVDRHVRAVSGLAVRISSRDRVTPNLDRDGIAVPFDLYVRLAFPGRAVSDLRETVEATALRLFDAVEAETGQAAEAGIDLLIDPRGSVHLIEANAKPGRIVYQRLSSGFYLTEVEKTRYVEMRRNTIRNPIRYARDLLEGTEG